MEKAKNFFKYNNAAILILALALIVGASVFAAETGREIIGTQTSSVQGIDNTLLLAADLENFNMDFKLENIEEDQEYFYVTYTYMDIDLVENSWQYQIKERTRKVSKKLKKDLGLYMAEELKQEYQTRIAYLKEVQAKEAEAGEQVREEVTEYSGLIGKTLDLAGNIFDGYEPVKKIEIPSPEPMPEIAQSNNQNAGDNAYDIYEEYVRTHPDQINELNNAIAATSTSGVSGGPTHGTGSSTISTSTPSINNNASSNPASTTPTASVATGTVTIFDSFPNN